MKKLVVLVIVVVLLQWWFRDPMVSAPNSDVSFGYITKYTGNSGRSDTLPMLVALHGNGDSANNFFNTALDQIQYPARIILIKGPLSYGGGDAWPWLATDFAKYGKPLSDVIGLLVQEYPTLGKPVLLGFSGGGSMAYYQALVYGNHYSSVFAISGQLSKDLVADEVFSPGAKTFAYHGKSDAVIAFSKGVNAVNMLRENGVNITFTEFQGGHHGIYKNMKTEISNVVEKKLKNLK